MFSEPRRPWILGSSGNAEVVFGGSPPVDVQKNLYEVLKNWLEVDGSYFRKQFWRSPN